MGCALLVGGKHMGDAVGILIQLVVKIQHSAAGVAKKSVHSLLAQDLYKLEASAVKISTTLDATPETYAMICGAEDLSTSVRLFIMLS